MFGHLEATIIAYKVLLPNRYYAESPISYYLLYGNLNLPKRTDMVQLILPYSEKFIFSLPIWYNCIYGNCFFHIAGITLYIKICYP